MYYNFDEEYEGRNLTKTELEFLEWCRIKFNLEKLGPRTIKDYGNFAKAVGVKEMGYKKGKDNQIEKLRTFADIEVNKRSYIIKDVYHTEQQEFSEKGGSTQSYETIFNLIIDNWWNQRNSNDYFASTEEIAIEAGLLQIPYQSLERMYGQEKISRLAERNQLDGGEYSLINLKSIQKLDWERRIEALIINQLKKMMLDRKNNRNYSISETLTYKNVTTKEVDGEITRIIEYKGEVPDHERKEIYAEIDVIQREKDNMLSTMKDNNQTPSFHQIKSSPALIAYYAELRDRGIYPTWKIIATPRAEFRPLRDDFREFLVRILIQNKQNKVFRGSLQAEYAKRGINIDEDDNIAFDFREDLYLVETILDGESLYKEIKNNDGSVDYLRLVCGRRTQEIRDGIKHKEKERPKF